MLVSFLSSYSVWSSGWSNPVWYFSATTSTRYSDGDNAGTYAGKTVIFGQETQPLQPIRQELLLI